jgi:integrase
MASLFKPTVTTYCLIGQDGRPQYRTADGQRVTMVTPGAVRTSKKSKIWYGRYKDANGTKRVKLCASKEASQQILAKLVVDAKQKSHGLGNPFEVHLKSPLVTHLDDFHRTLLARNNTAKHARQTHRRAKAVLDGCRFNFFADVQPSRVQEWLAEERRAGRLTITTSNYYLRDTKSLFAWMVKDGRAPANPLEVLSGLNAEIEDHRERRDVPTDEFAALVLATRQAPVRKRLAGPDRAMLYLVTASTGFRASEMASLTPESFDLKSSPPTITVDAAHSKRRRQDVQPIRADLGELLQPYLSGKPAGKRVWAGVWWKKAAKMIRADLKTARTKWLAEAKDDAEELERRKKSSYLAYVDDVDRVFDFHALRHQFISSLAAAGVHPKVAQALARHSTISLTMDRYTHLGLMDTAAALDKLPDLPGPPSKSNPAALAATGTDPVRLDRALTKPMRPPCVLVSEEDGPDGPATEPENLDVRQLETAMIGGETERPLPDSNRGWRICNPLP